MDQDTQELEETEPIGTMAPAQIPNSDFENPALQSPACLQCSEGHRDTGRAPPRGNLTYGMRKDRLTLIILLAGFAVLFLEARYYHSGILEKKPVAWVPTVLLPLLALACLFGLSKASGLRKTAIALFVIGAAAGLMGTYFHTDGLKAERFSMLLGTKPEKEDQGSAQQSRRDDDRRPQEEDRRSEQRGEEAEQGENKEEDPPPPLVALSVTGLTLLGLVTVWPMKQS